MKKKKRCILHIGMHKTGTTAIQVFLKKHLPYNNYEYLTCDGLSNHSRCIYTLFSDNPYAHKLHKRYQMTNRDVDRYKQKMILSMTAQIIQSKNDNFVISAEVLSGNIIKDDDIYRMKCYLDELFEETTVIGYVRKFDEFIMSNFQQVLHMRKPGNDDFASFAPNYRAAFEKFYKVFDEDRVTLKLYDRETLKNGNVVDDLIDTIGLDIPLVEREVTETNKSLTLYGLKLLAIYRYYGEQETVGRDAEIRNLKMLEKLYELDGPKVRLSRKEIDRIARLKKDDIKWITEKIKAILINSSVSKNTEEINSIKSLFYIDKELCKKISSLVDEEIVKNKIHIKDMIKYIKMLK